MKIPLLLLTSVLFFTPHLCAADKTITYQNQRGSTLTLIWQNEKNEVGTLSGTFTTAVGDCKQDVGVALPIQGYFNGNAIGFNVNFPHCKQVIAMTGYVTEQDSQLQTLWLDAVQAKDPAHANWNSNIIGTDFYKRTT